MGKLAYALEHPLAAVRLFWQRKLFRSLWLLYRSGSIYQHSVFLGDRRVRFSIRDRYSRNWFFPRYQHGELHEKPVTDLLLRELRTSTCFVDVGAHLGFFTCIAAVVMPNGVVYSFEVDRHSFRLLQRNVCLNRLSNVGTVHAAAYDDNGYVMYEDLGQPAATQRALDEIPPGLTASYAEAITLDRFFYHRESVPDIIKIDVEGGELQVLYGLAHTLEMHMPTLLVEVHPHEWEDRLSGGEKILSYLWGHGYTVYIIEGHRAGQAKQSSGLEMAEIRSPRDIQGNDMLFAQGRSEGHC